MSRALLVAAVAGCAGPDPCADVAGACVAVRIESATVGAIDQLELDVLHGELHAYAATAPGGGGAVELPVVTALAIAIDGDLPIEVGVVAAGKLGAMVLGTGAASTTLAPGQRAGLTIELSPIGACVDGGLYCGGDKLAGDPATLYQCDRDGVPKARGRCRAGCVVAPTTDDTCRAADDGQPGPCTTGGFYCGGDEVDGDPQALYRCEAGVGVRTEVCVAGCVVETGRDDHCR
ncbi:MAG: hypothetical protein IPL61_04555 [Myxococcales bacterium]|nr:hypothetical protein [Myxococcales bacterium]